MDWFQTKNYLRGRINKLKELSEPVRIAAFDLDDTLIARPKGKDKSWNLLDPLWVDKITKLVNKKFLIIIFSNQGGMSRNKNFDQAKWCSDMEKITGTLMSQVSKYYFTIYVAKNYDLYRKPNIGLWNQMKNDLKEEFHLDKIKISKNSFYIGDAAGRTSPGIFKKRLYPSSSKGDFSDVDRKFALNVGLQFLTPEEYLLKDTPQIPYQLSGVNPQELLESTTSDGYHFVPRTKEMIVLVGVPGAGKTEFAKKYILPHHYVHISQDICKTKDRCLSLTKAALEKNKSVVIDGTNPDVLSRMQYTCLAQDYGYHHVRCIILNTNIAIAKHLNNVRHVYSRGEVPKISDIVYNVFQKNYVKPQKSEHFDKIETVDFYFDPDYLNDLLWKKIFLRWSE